MRDERLINLANGLEQLARETTTNNLQIIFDTIEEVLSRVQGSWRIDPVTDKYRLYTFDEWHRLEEATNRSAS